MSKTVNRILSLMMIGAAAGVAAWYFNQGDPVPEDVEFDLLIVRKKHRQMLAYSKGKLIKRYSISLGKSPEGPKQFEGDNKTPEGIYRIDSKNAQSAFHKNLGISYPSQDDCERAKKEDKKPGKDIKIHGLRNGSGYIGKFHRFTDWTAGCVALTNEEMDEVFAHTPVGIPIKILP